MIHHKILTTSVSIVMGVIGSKCSMWSGISKNVGCNSVRCWCITS